MPRRRPAICVTLCSEDSAHIQMFEAEWRNRKGRRSGKPEFVPAYTMEDAMGVLKNFVGCEYGKIIHLSEGIRVRFIDAGHLMGSASIEIWLKEDGKEEKIVFSGDIGNTEQPLIKDPTYLEEADYVVMESTYGDRNHGERPDYVKSLAEIIQRTFDRAAMCDSILCSGKNPGDALFYPADQGRPLSPGT